PRRGNRRPHSPVPAAADHEIEVARVLRFAQSEQPPPPLLQWLKIIGRRSTRVLAEKDGVAAPVETGQIVQRDGGLRFRDLDRASVMPCPLDAFRAENF